MNPTVNTQAPASSGVDWWAETAGDSSSSGTTEKPTAEPSPSPASLVTALRSGTIENQAAKMRLFAQQRFPTQPDEERLARYGVLDGKIVYRDEDGKLRYELDTPGRIASWLGENALPVALSTAAAGAAVGTGGAAVPVMMAALGGAGGVGYRKAIGAMQGDEQTVGGNLKDMATEGAVDAAGAAGGQLVGKVIANRRAVRDLANFSASNAQRLIDLAKARGVQLTPAEATNLGSLIQHQSSLGQGMDEAADTLRKFYGDRTDKVMKAIDDFIGSTPGPHETGQMAADASGSLIDAAKASRKAASKPLYDATVTRDALLPKEAMQSFADDPVMRKAFAKVRNEGLFVGDDVPDNSLAMVDAVKKEFDDQISSAMRAGENGRAAALQSRRAQLLDLADQHFPDYKTARAAFAGNSPDVDALKQSAIGIVSKYQGTQLEKAAGTLVNLKSDPERVAWARQQFENADKLDDWNTIASQAMRDIFENARGTVAGGDAAIPAKFRQAIFGSERARDVMKAALGPQRFSDLQGLAEVLEAVSRVPRQQSITHFAGEAAQAEARQAAPVTTFLRNLKISDPGGELLDALTSRSVDKYRAVMAKVITNPDAIADLQNMRVLRALSPTSEKRLNAVGILLAKAAKGGTSDLLSAPETTLPPQAAGQ